LARGLIQSKPSKSDFFSIFENFNMRKFDLRKSTFEIVTLIQFILIDLYQSVILGTFFVAALQHEKTHPRHLTKSIKRMFNRIISKCIFSLFLLCGRAVKLRLYAASPHVLDVFLCGKSACTKAVAATATTKKWKDKPL
jgi:hypothetical protein